MHTMTNNEIIKYFPMTVTGVFRILYCLETHSINECFDMIYQSEFYEMMCRNADEMFAFAPYWAYEWIMKEKGGRAKEPLEQYKTGINPDRIMVVASVFERLRIRTGASPAMISELLSINGMFDKMIRSNQALMEVENCEFVGPFKDLDELMRSLNS